MEFPMIILQNIYSGPFLGPKYLILCQMYDNDRFHTLITVENNLISHNCIFWSFYLISFSSMKWLFQMTVHHSNPLHMHDMIKNYFVRNYNIDCEHP